MEIAVDSCFDIKVWDNHVFIYFVESVDEVTPEPNFEWLMYALTGLRLTECLESRLLKAKTSKTKLVSTAYRPRCRK